jgi:anti-sigma28 factor (negative regulator of flagellin synthesis)
MSSINGLGGSNPLQQTQSVTPKTTAGQTTAASKPSLSDRLELSGVGHLLSNLKTNDIRTDKVAAIKAQIASGVYDADGTKLDGSLDKVLDAINE